MTEPTPPSMGLRKTAWRVMALVTVAGLFAASPARAQWEAASQIRAHLSATRLHVNVNEPIYVQFQVINKTDETVILAVPGTTPDAADEEVGLPLGHVFSGEAFGALTIRNESNRTWTVANGYNPPAKVSYVALAPRASVGTVVDIRKHYPALRTPGDYRITWSPYGGAVESNVLLIRVASLKQAEIMTDQGSMVVQFFYEDAPRHVENFIELARKGFYNNLTFHRIETGYFIQGGCPNGDGTGIRPDGRKLDAELSNRPQARGMVSMAIVDDDPDSGSCQFFISNTRVPEWDGKYTVFGRLSGDESYETLDALMTLATDDNGFPLDRIIIRSIRITEMPREE